MATVLRLLPTAVSAALHRQSPISSTTPIAAAAAAAAAIPTTRSGRDLDRRVEELIGEEDEPNGPRPVAADLIG